MSIRVCQGALMALAFTAISTVANAQSPNCQALNLNNGNFDGRFYEVVSFTGPWIDAKTAAEARPLRGNVQGHLATINSPAEDRYLHCLVQAAIPGKEAWAGAKQDDCADEPGCGWKWENGEIIDPTNTTGLHYTNWVAKPGVPLEPNNLGGSEDHLAIGRYSDFIGWNDEGSDLTRIGGYVVEYGDKLATIAATDCATPAGCNPTGVLNVKFPPNSTVGGNYTVQTWRITDPRFATGRCGKDPLPLDLLPTEGDEVIVPPYLCGYPEFVMIKSDAPNVVVNKGVVELIADAEKFFGPNAGKFGCNDPISQDEPYLGDPTRQDVVTYQPDIRTSTHENASTVVGNAFKGTPFEGSFGEVTFGCINPPRGGGKTTSWYGVGFRIHAGELDDGGGSLTQTFLITLQSYKLMLLRKSVDASKGKVKASDWNALDSHLANTIKYHNRGDYVNALKTIGSFLTKVRSSDYAIVPGQNFNGEHTYRAENIRDLYKRRWIPDLP